MSGVPILYVVPTLDIGGTQRHLVELLGGLDRRAFAPALYCLRAEGRLIPEVRALGVEVIDGHAGETLKGPELVRAVLGLRAVLRRRGVQIVHSYLFHANLLGTLAARLARVPVALVSKRSLDVYGATERTVCRVANGLADRVTANAEAVRRHVHRFEGCPLEKIAVLPNGVDSRRVTDESGRASRPLRDAGESGPVVGTLGRLSTKKGQIDLIDAAAVVVSRVPEARFVLVGDGPLRPELEQRVTALGLDKRVRFLGSVTEGARLLGQMDLFVLPSHMEGMPNALIEAMAAGRPTVATDAGGNAEVVADGETGLIVPPRNPARLADAILTLLKDPERAEAMGRAGRGRYRGALHGSRDGGPVRGFLSGAAPGPGASRGR